MRLTSLAAVASIAAVGVAAACGGSSSYMTSSTGGGGGGGGTNQVVMSGSAFSPTTLNVTAGATVTWTNQDAFAHTVTYSSGPGTAFSGSVAGGTTFQHTFTLAGTYQYYCTIHGTPTTGMHATIVVQ